jgi:formylglycine-generating enzyme required for sulfatase activity
MQMKLLFSLTSLLILTFTSRGNGEWLYYKYYPWVWDNMSQDWLYLSGSSDGKIYSYRASTQEWEEFSVPASILTVDLNSSVSLKMIWVDPGTFRMGSPTTEAGRETHESEHIVTLTQGFYLGKYEVTQAQYEAVIGSNPSDFNATSNGNRPVETVTWTEAVAFCTQLTTQEQAAGRLSAGWAYVLPTESQWEYACRAGTTTIYSWGDSIAGMNANYNASGYSQTRDVGQYAANAWGFFDMHGNVWEWTADWYQAAYPTGNPVVDPTGPASGSQRVLRSGSWWRDGTFLRSATRNPNNPSNHNSSIGFRVSLQESQ